MFPLLTNSDYYTQAFFAMMLPAMMWFMCCVRAWQFHGLLQEAEVEAEERSKAVGQFVTGIFDEPKIKEWIAKRPVTDFWLDPLMMILEKERLDWMVW